MPSRWLKQVRMPRRLRSLMTSMLRQLPRSDVQSPREVVGVQAYCPSCRKITTNRLLVVGKLMKARYCEQCGKVLRADAGTMAECYLDEFSDRLGDLVKSIKLETMWYIRAISTRLPRWRYRRVSTRSPILAICSSRKISG